MAVAIQDGKVGLFLCARSRTPDAFAVTFGLSAHGHTCPLNWITRMQVLVQGLVPGGAAEASAIVNVGDEIVTINHVLVRDLGLGMHARNPLALFFVVWGWRLLLARSRTEGCDDGMRYCCAARALTHIPLRRAHSRRRDQDAVGSRKYNGGADLGRRHHSAAEAGSVFQSGCLRRNIRSWLNAGGVEKGNAQHHHASLRWFLHRSQHFSALILASITTLTAWYVGEKWNDTSRHIEKKIKVVGTIPGR
jgi:hypothetical protein